MTNKGMFNKVIAFKRVKSKCVFATCFYKQKLFLTPLNGYAKNNTSFIFLRLFHNKLFHAFSSKWITRISDGRSLPGLKKNIIKRFFPAL